MHTVGRLLETKGHDVYEVGPDATVLDVLRVMADRNVGSVLVTKNGRLIGIFTERIYARNVFLRGRSSPDTPVRDVMDTQVICVPPDQTVAACMALMTEKRVRHLPVLRNGQVVGVVSMGDLLKNQIEDQQFTIEQLEHFISG